MKSKAFLVDLEKVELFLRDHKDLIDSESWEQLYIDIHKQNFAFPKMLTYILYHSNIDPLLTMNSTPPNFLAYINENSEDFKDLDEIVVPNNIKGLKPGFLDEASTVKKVYLPKTIKYIGPYCFSEMNKDFEINYDGLESDWKDIQIDGSNFDDYPIKINFSDGTSKKIKYGPKGFTWVN